MFTKPFLGLGLLLSLSGCGGQYVQQGEVGLLINNVTGQIESVLDPGFRMTIPIGKHIIAFPARQQQYVMVSAGGEGQVAGDDSVKVNSAEGQSFQVDASVAYRIKSKNDVAALYTKYGMDFDDIVAKYYRSKFRTAISNAFAALPMSEAIGRNGKLSVEKQALEDLQKSFDADGIVVNDVMIRAVHVPEAIAESISSKTKAENELVQARTKAQQQVVEAEAAANAAVATANGQAKARMISATAEAQANRLVSGSLTPGLVRMAFINKLSDKIQLVVPEKSLVNFGDNLSPGVKVETK